MIITLLVLILLAILVPGLLRGVFGLIGLTIIALIAMALIIGPAKSETWKKSPYEYETWRSDKGEVWKKDRYGYDLWRSDRGEVCEKQRYGGGIKCQGGK